MEVHTFANFKTSIRWEDLKPNQLVHPDSMAALSPLSLGSIPSLHLRMQCAKITWSILSFGGYPWQGHNPSGTSAVGDCSHQLHAGLLLFLPPQSQRKPQ